MSAKEKELFDAYAQGNLSGEEQAALWKRYFKSEFQDQLSDWDENPTPEILAAQASLQEPVPILGKFQVLRTIKRQIAWGAAATLVILSGVFYLSRTSNTDPETLIASALKPYEKRSNILLGGSGSVPWEVSYDKQDYENTTKTIENQKVTTPEACFYGGLSYLKMQPPQYDRAILSLLLAEKEQFKITQVRWWLGVAYYRTGDFANAKKYLESIQQGQSRYEEAQKLLKNI